MKPRSKNQSINVVQIGAVQLSSSVLSIQKNKISIQVDVPIRIVGLDICENLLLVWGDGKVAVYQMGAANEKPYPLGLRKAFKKWTFK